MLRCLRLYATPIVLMVWAVLWWVFGLQSSMLIGVFLTLTALSHVVAERQRQAIRKAMRAESR